MQTRFGRRYSGQLKQRAAAAAAAPHKTLGKHPERAAYQPAGRGATWVKNVPAGRRPHPCRWTGGSWQGSKSILKGLEAGPLRGATAGGTLAPRPAGMAPSPKKQRNKTHCTGGNWAAGPTGGVGGRGRRREGGLEREGEGGEGEKEPGEKAESGRKRG